LLINDILTTAHVLLQVLLSTRVLPCLQGFALPAGWLG
jgi:hypothetical protein